MLKRIFKVAPLIAALSVFTTGAVAETEASPEKCLANAKVLSTATSLRTNTDPDCGDYYMHCDASGKCYECIVCTHGGPYCWEM